MQKSADDGEKEEPENGKTWESGCPGPQRGEEALGGGKMLAREREVPGHGGHTRRGVC